MTTLEGVWYTTNYDSAELGERLRAQSSLDLTHTLHNILDY